MASVSFKKLKSSQQVKALLRHCDREKRLETKVHSNEHIDKSLTGHNRQLYDYGESCRFYDSRIAELDATTNKNKRKDRVTCFALEIPFPDGLSERSDDEQLRWENRIVNLMLNTYGCTNIMNVYTHVDEVHEYIDSRTNTKNESRKHMHVFVIPEIDGQLNGKAFSAARKMRNINNTIQEITQKEFQLDFMDGSQRKSRDSVESLKNKSEKLAMKQRQESLVKQQVALSHEQDNVNALKTHLDAQISDLNEKQVEFTVEKQKWLKTANMELQDRVSKIDEYLKDASERIENATKDSDMSRKQFMTKMKYKDGTTIEDRYQKWVEEQKAKQQQALAREQEIARRNRRLANLESKYDFLSDSHQDEDDFTF